MVSKFNYWSVMRAPNQCEVGTVRSKHDMCFMYFSYTCLAPTNVYVAKWSVMYVHMEC